jgi:hypothetical protein
MRSILELNMSGLNKEQNLISADELRGIDESL